MLFHLAVWMLVAGHLAAAPLVPAASRTTYVTYGLAFIGYFLLTVTFVCGPLARRTGQRRFQDLLARQRWLGIYSFLVVAAHVACLWHFKYAWDISKATGGLFKWVAFVALHGAFLILLAMFLTSSDAAVRALGPNWKRLHRLGLLAYTLIAVGVLWASARDASLRPFFPVFLLFALGVLVARLSERKANAHG
ncbi:MAG: hypothetical protein AAB434_04435 [Planctomycetota bacterium]